MKLNSPSLLYLYVVNILDFQPKVFLLSAIDDTVIHAVIIFLEIAFNLVLKDVNSAFESECISH